MLMKNLVLSSFVLVATSQAMGCILVSDDDDTGAVQVRWETLTANYAPDRSDYVEQLADCPTGATTAIIYALPEGQSDEPYEDWVDCGDQEGTAADLPAGRYFVWVRLTDDTRVMRFAESESVIVDLTDGETETTSTLPILVDYAYYTAAWTILDTDGSTELSCEDAAATAVTIDITDNEGGGDPYSVEHACDDDLAGTAVASAPVPIRGDYTLQLSLMDDEGAIGESAAITADEAGELEWGNQYKPLDVDADGVADVVDLTLFD